MNPARLFIETVGIVALAEVGVVLGLPIVAPQSQGSAQALLNAALLILLAGPAIFWRCLAAARRAIGGPQTAADTEAARAQRGMRLPTAIAMTAAAQLLGLAFTTAGVLWLRDTIDSEAATRFERHVEHLETEVRQRFERPLYGLKGARGAIAGGGAIERAAFGAYVASRDLDSEFPGVRGFGFIERVQRADLARFVEQERADGAPAFEVRSAGTAADLYVIKSIEPLARNRAAWGYDVGAEPLHRAAVERAVATGEPTLSASVVLVQDEQRGAGVLYLLPVYRSGASPATPEQRRAALLGLVYTPIIASELLAGTVNAVDGMLDFTLTDVADGRVPIYSSQGRTQGAGQEPAHALTAARVLDIGGRQLLLQPRSTAAFGAGIDRSRITYAAVGGALLSFVLALIVWLLASGRVRAQSLAHRMTLEHDRVARLAREGEARLAHILDGTNAGTWEWNVQTGEYRFDQRWAAMIGYTVAELAPQAGQGWSRHVHPDDLKRSDDLLAQHFEGSISHYECEIRLGHKDGHWVWVLDRARLASRGADGRPEWMAGTRMDITARKQADDELRASKSFLDRAGRIAGVGGWEVDLHSGVLTWSEQTCCIYDMPVGHRPSRDEGVSFFAPADRALIERTAEDCLRSGKPWDLELPATTRLGRSIWVRSVGAVEHENGRPVRLVGALQDVTVQRRLQDELRQANQVLHVILENLPCGLSVFNADMELVASNREFRRLLDFPDALFEATPPRFERFIRFNAERGEYGPGDVEQIVQRLVEQATALTGQHQFERLRPDGTPLEVRGCPLPGGGLVTTYSDISERKRAQREVERNAALLRGAIETIDEAFVLFDPDDRLVVCNEKYRQVYPGMAHLMVPGNTFEQIIRPGAENGDYADAVGRVEEWLAERVAAHRSGDTTLVQRLASGRTLRIVERKMPDGHTVGFRIDITDLVQATDAAREASKAKSQFLANMSHEIRTPMNAVLGMLSLLRKTTLTPRQADYADKCDGAARSLLGLLNDILDFSKVEAGKMALDPHPFGIDQLLGDLSVILSATAGSKGIEVLFDLDPALPTRLVGDAMRLQQVLVNLGGNAVKFTQQGEVVVSIAVVARDAGQVTLEFAVRDTGIGIAPENQQRIYSGFTQAEGSTTRRFGGTGLGLAICQRLVSMMGGTLALDSQLGKGSRFHFGITLALAGDDALRLPAPPRPSRQRALIVDDNALARESLQRMVRSLDWDTDTVASGESALARLRDGAAYDAVFVDWQMPGMDGWQTCQAIRALQPAGSPPLIVMVTAHGREMLAQRDEAEQALLDGFLVKPVTPTMLLDAVAAANGGNGAQSAPAAAAAAPQRRLAGLRVLVAEDNANNQQIARELLEDEGAVVQIAGNGLEAVDAVAASTLQAFDVVLMDLQMPVMDGYTATHRIRHQLGRAALPIVAITANAMASDRDACMAAGMNGHIGKPFDLDRLVGMIRQLTGRADADQTAAAPRALAGMGDAVLVAASCAGLDIEQAVLRMGGKFGVYQRLLRSFVTDLAGMPALLATHQERADWTETSRQLHTLKGLAGTLGATALASSAADAETALAARPAAHERTQTLARLKPALLSSHAALETFLAAIEAGVSAAVPGVQAAADAQDPVALASGLDELAWLLADSDMEALALMSRLRARHAGDKAPGLTALDDAVANLDFGRALAHCNEMREALRS